MATDERTSFLVAEVLTDAIASLNRNRGRSAVAWREETNAQHKTEIDRIKAAIAAAPTVYVAVQTDPEAAALEAAIVKTLIPEIAGP